MENKRLDIVDPRQTYVSLYYLITATDQFGFRSGIREECLMVRNYLIDFPLTKLIFLPSSSIIRDVQGICATGLASLAYYYFDFKEIGKQDRRGLLTSLLIQLCTRSHSRYDVLSHLHATHDNGLRQPSDTDLIQCLKDVLALPRQEKVYIIVDAVDECSNSSGFPKTAREKVLDLLEEIVDLNLPNLRICIISRPEIDIRNVLEPLNPCQMSLHGENGQKEDILEYIRTVVLADRKMRRWRLEDKQLVIDTLSAIADGM
jgi:hypothetical protein